MQSKNLALRKRAQIAKANRTMFIWVACASVLVGFAFVASLFLIQMLTYNEKVLAEKDNTVSILKQNNNNIAGLESEIRALDANQALIDAKARPTDRALQVVLDALPADANADALGSSLQEKLLVGNGVNLKSLQVDSVVTGGQIMFSFSISGDENALKMVLSNLERSIRTIQIISLKIENQDNVRVLTAQAKAFYEPKLIIELKDKLVKK